MTGKLFSVVSTIDVQSQEVQILSIMSTGFPSHFIQKIVKAHLYVHLALDCQYVGKLFGRATQGYRFLAQHYAHINYIEL